jgi:hypothetical protein
MINLGALRNGFLGSMLAAGLGCGQPAREPPPPERPAKAGMSQDRRFSGFVRLETKSGIDSVRVELINLDLPARTTVDSVELPFRGALIAYIQAGSAIVATAGIRQTRNQGQIWTIPPGAPLGITTGRDAVSLQAVLVENR